MVPDAGPGVQEPEDDEEENGVVPGSGPEEVLPGDGDEEHTEVNEDEEEEQQDLFG